MQGSRRDACFIRQIYIIIRIELKPAMHEEEKV